MVEDYPDYTLPVVHIGAITVTGSVTVSGSVHVDTVAADNIIIDKLTVGAYTERRSTLTNNGTTAGWIDADGVRRRGKFFPRGCRGFMRNVEVYCKDAGAAGGTITVYVAPTIGMGQVASRVITVSAGGAEMWRTAVFDMMWNYDSLFIWVYGSSDDMRVGYDEGTPHDAYRSDDSGETWYYSEFRTWFRSYITGETCGDIPVSGTINTIEIPSRSSPRLATDITDLPLTETTIKTVDGAGHAEYIFVQINAKTDSHKTVIQIYCDGNLAYGLSFLGLNLRGYGTTTPDISLLQYGVDAACAVHIGLKFSFTRELKITMYSVDTANQSGVLEGMANLIK